MLEPPGGPLKYTLAVEELHPCPGNKMIWIWPVLASGLVFFLRLKWECIITLHFSVHASARQVGLSGSGSCFACLDGDRRLEGVLYFRDPQVPEHQISIRGHDGVFNR